MSDQIPGRHWQGEEGLSIDTRGLNPPDPLVAVLWHLERPGQSGPVTAFFDRYPVHLFAELAERGWKGEFHELEAGQVKLILTQIS